jgi:penicillin-binding protein 1A
LPSGRRRRTHRLRGDFRAHMQKTIEPTRLPQTAPPPPPVTPPPVDPFGGDDGGPPERPKLKKLRIALVAAGLGFIAFISVIFGMMMAVAAEIPDLENEVQFKNAKNSILYADSEEEYQLGKLTGNENRILVGEDEISPYIQNAVIAIEDRRFYEHRGVDYRGIGRALWQDVLSGSAQQGASTITQQFVKNALAAQGDRSVFQKLREAAAAYHLERKWSKQKILTQYLNSVYFGNGAYGIESAMRTYFGEEKGIFDEEGALVTVDPDTGEPVDRDQRAAATATPAQAAFLAGIIASPSAYDPIQNLQAAEARKDLVLDRMLEQEMISQEQHDQAQAEVPPGEDDINPPQPDSDEPYFTTWVTQQAVDKFGADRVFGGGMEIKTTLDPELQAAANSAVSQMSGIGPSVSLVTIENATGEVKALVGGDNFREKPFNLATNGQRQPGSAFKPFILLAALQQGDYGPGSVFASQPKELPFTAANGEKDLFRVANYEDQYLGSASLTTATAQSDNSIYAELGMKVGRDNVAEMANEMGIRTELSTNPAMLLGGLKQGVTPLEMAFAYSTLANSGKRVCAEWASYKCGPVAIKAVEGEDKPDRKTREVFSQEVADTAKTMLSYVITSGTGTRAQVGEFAAGKTGTTENYGDAWFCGFIDKYTTCVWVGYADKVQPMETEYAGSPVAGGTWPAAIWQSFMSQAIAIRDQREAEDAAEDDDETTTAPVPVAPSAPAAPAPEEEAPAPAPEPEQPAPTPEAPAPAPEEPPAPAPAPQEPAPPPEPPSEGGGGTGPGRGNE